MRNLDTGLGTLISFEPSEHQARKCVGMTIDERHRGEHGSAAGFDTCGQYPKSGSDVIA